MKLQNFLKTLGPGILFASTAIGVSHLMQSTRAGANYGFALVGFIIAANLFKFPFFEFGSRYANATGKSLIDGYYKMGKSIIWLYFLIVIGSMFFVTSAVAFVTTAFFENLFNIHFNTMPYLSSGILLFTITILLAIGKFKILDSFIKIVGITLLITTVFAFILVLFKGPINPNVNFLDFSKINYSSLPFIIALMGWMPTAVDLSTWNSLWTEEKIKISDFKPTLKETLFEFNLGYWVSAILSICFVTLGAFLVYGSGSNMPTSKVLFASKIISLYTQSIGNWSYYIISISAFSIMLGTSIGVLDGYARSISRTTSLIFEKKETKKNYIFWLLITAIGGFLVIFFFIKNLKELVDLATTISFLIAPFIAVINLKLVTGKDLQENEKPKKPMLVLSYFGIVFLTGFSLYFLWLKFI